MTRMPIRLASLSLGIGLLLAQLTQPAQAALFGDSKSVIDLRNKQEALQQTVLSQQNRITELSDALARANGQINIGQNYGNAITNAPLSGGLKIIIDDSVGNFIVREMGLFDEDGTLIAICNTPDTEKVAISTGVDGRLTMLMHIVVVDSSVLECEGEPCLFVKSQDEFAATCRLKNFGVAIAEPFSGQYPF